MPVMQSVIRRVIVLREFIKHIYVIYGIFASGRPMMVVA
jgi:hypothetical protein